MIGKTSKQLLQQGHLHSKPSESTLVDRVDTLVDNLNTLAIKLKTLITQVDALILLALTSPGDK